VISNSSAAAATPFPENHRGLFLVTGSSLPVLDPETLANDVIARLERDLVRANPNRAHVSYLPESFFESRRDTPLAVLRRILHSINPFTFSA
jgi:hypothetical protein